MGRKEINLKGTPVEGLHLRIELSLLRLIKRAIGILAEWQFSIERRWLRRLHELAAKAAQETVRH